jgi:hypothetical protein
VKPGSVVTYVSHDGAYGSASVVAVVGSGASGYKIVDLYVSGEVIGSVEHEGDAGPDSGYWTMTPPPEPAPVRDSFRLLEYGWAEAGESQR